VVHLVSDEHGECFHIPRDAVSLPLEWRPPDGFVPEDETTWPAVEGRLEYVGGKIHYMPPGGDVQQDVCIDLATLLGNWVRARPEFLVGGNEAGMLLGGEVRAADAAVWTRADAGAHTGRFRRVPPVLAVEVAGSDARDAVELRSKAHWYLDAGVAVVWLVFPQRREVVVVEVAGEKTYGESATLPGHARLPGLAPAVAELFFQLDRRG
jgi:Uma2 family endonuclease